MREIAKLKDSKSKKKEQLDNTLREIKKNTEYSVTKNIDLHVSPMKDLVLETIISPIEKTNDTKYDLAIKTTKIEELNQDYDTLKSDYQE